MITFTTDFGNVDGFVGIMKGVILGIAPNVQLIDISNEVAAGDIASGAWILANSYPYFPEGTIHVGVVDPGVGSPRRGIVVRTRAHTFVAPDNGLLTYVLQHAGPVDCYFLNEQSFWRPTVSSTFHGRDIFAPVAAHLALGKDPAQLGTPIIFEDLVRLPDIDLKVDHSNVFGSVVYIDRFGNLITNIPNSVWDSTAKCTMGGVTIPLGLTYSSVDKGQVVAFPGSHGYVELAVNGGSASTMLEGAVGSRVHLVLH